MFLAWIPLLGPIFQGIAQIFKGFQDVTIEKTKADVQESQIAAQVTETFHDDIGVRLCRDIVMLPTAVWAGLTLWDSIVVHHWPTLVWSTGPVLQGSGLEFLPYVVISFLFGVNLMHIWKR